ASGASAGSASRIPQLNSGGLAPYARLTKL
ncbi:MAG: hypothetical protein QOH87_5171, partial [Trebonia sp.]|nr:hypothetical protein [Trebonia sp.]